LANFRQHITDIGPILSNWRLPILALWLFSQYCTNMCHHCSGFPNYRGIE